MTVNVNYAAAGGAAGGNVVQNITNVTNNTYNATGNQLISGGGVVWRGNYDYTVAAATYQIQGTTYSSPQTDITLSASDPTNDRIDLIVVNASNAVAVIAGTPAATPAQPSFDPTTQIPLTFVYVTAATTQPATATNENVYLENTEWTGTASGAGFNLASTTNPFQGTKDIEATAVVAGNYVEYTKPAAGTITPDQYNTLVFVLRSKAAWPSAKSLTIQLYNGTSPVGVPVTVKDGVSNFVSSVTGNYQFIILATSLFQSAGLPINKIRATVAGGGGSIGFYLDYWFWQAGVVQSQAAAPLIFRGTWSSAVSYSANDVVFTAGAAYIALASSVNKNPATNPAIWDLFPGSAGSGTVTSVAITNQSVGRQFTVTNPTTTPTVTVDGPIGYLNIPQNSQSAAYTTVAADSGKHLLHPTADVTARTFTIDSNANVPYPIGTAITFVNQHGAGVLTIAVATDTMYLAGAGTTGNRTLAANGVATAVKIATTEWIISGTGLT